MALKTRMALAIFLLFGLLFAFFMVDCHLNPQEHIRLWPDGSGNLIGYAILGEDPSVDWQVSPEHEMTGIEDEAMAWAETRLTEPLSLPPQR